MNLFLTQANGHNSTTDWCLTIPTLILIDYSLIVKAASLIFISGHGWLFHLLRKGKQALLYFGKEFWAAQTCLHFMKVLTVTCIHP